MSIEPHCYFCGLVDRDRCKTEEASAACPHAPQEARTGVITSGPLAGLRRGYYGAIYADPAWTFETYSDKGKGRSPEQHYECQSLDDICALPVGQIAAKDCALFMWTIDTHLPQAFEVLSAWGFTYKTVAFTWVKLQSNVELYSPDERDVLSDRPFFMGPGHWTRANPEICLLATRGSPKRQSASIRRLHVSPRREHSRKPDELRNKIEQLVVGPYVELFSRTTRAGWDMVGNEVGKFSEPHEDDFTDII